MRYKNYLFLLLSFYPLSGLQAQQTAAATGVEVAGVPEIYLAAKQGRTQKVRSLIANGSDINAVNSSGRTVLMVAVFYGNKSITRELLSEGAELDTVDAQGRTALMIAVANKKVEMVSLLLSAGADVKIEDKKKNTALTLAGKTDLSKSNKKRLTKLLEKAAE